MDEDQQLSIARALAEEAVRRLAETGEEAGEPIDPAALGPESALIRSALNLLAEAQAAAAIATPVDDDEPDDPPSTPVHDEEPEAEHQPPATETDPSPEIEDQGAPAHNTAQDRGPSPEESIVAPAATNANDDPQATEGESLARDTDESSTSPERPTDAVPEPSAAEPPHPRIAFAVSANARVNESFQANIAVRGGEPEAVVVLDCEVPDGLGLAFDPAGAILQGIPTSAGDFALTVHYRFADADPDRPTMAATAMLTVNPDPRSLWQDRPSDREAAGWKSDAVHTLVAAGEDRRVVAASKRGRSHAHIGGFRDDDYCILVEEARPWTLIAVADGAGSAERARIGSHLAATTAARRAAAYLAGGLGETLVEHTLAGEAAQQRGAREVAYEVLGGAALAAVKAIEQAAERDGATVKDYATTLLLVGHRPLGERHLLIAFWVGDGAIAALEPFQAHLLGTPDGGAFAGQTRFLDRSIVADANAIMSRIRVTTVADLQALLVMSDGVSDAHFASDQDLADPVCWQTFWHLIEPLLAGEHPGEELLAWLDFWSPGNHDDRTIAVLW